jgi:hypothetical protein
MCFFVVLTDTVIEACVRNNQPTPLFPLCPCINRRQFVRRFMFHPQITPFSLLFLIYPQIAVTFATRADEATRALLPAGDTDVDLDDHVYKVSSFSLLPYIGISHLSSCTPSSCIFIPSMASSLWTTVGPGA